MASLQVEGSMLETSCGSPHYACPEVIRVSCICCSYKAAKFCSIKSVLCRVNIFHYNCLYCFKSFHGRALQMRSSCRKQILHSHALLKCSIFLIHISAQVLNGHSDECKTFQLVSFHSETSFFVWD